VSIILPLFLIIDKYMLLYSEGRRAASGFVN